MPNDNLKLKDTAVAVFVGVLTLVILYSLLWGPAKKFADSFTPSRLISVSAEGKTTAEPDVAKFTFSVVSEGFNPKVLAEENNKKVNKAIDFVKSKEIDSKDIKTTQYNLSPKYEYDEKSRKSFISGYTLTQTVDVKIRDLKTNLEKLTEILGVLPDLGINQISSISFEVDEPEKYLAEARDKAFEKAEAKAKSMAEKNKVKLGRVVNVSEYGGPTPIPYYESFGRGGGVADLKTAAPSIEPGTQEITVQVSVTYEIK